MRDLRAELGEAQRRCEELYDLAPTPYITLDGTGLIRDLNLPAVELLGVERQFAIGLPIRIFVATGYRVALATHLLRFRDEGTAATELRINTRRARGVDVELRSRRTLDGGDLCFTSVINLTSQHHAEQERLRLEEAERAALDANRTKDYFIAGLSHELRAPLAPVLVAVSALKSGALPTAEVHQLCDIIRRNVKIQARLIDDLLDVSRIASNKLSVDRKPTDVHQAATDALTMLEGEVRARRLLLTTEMEARRSCVHGDPDRLRQVFVNLIKNATKFTPEGGRISVRSWNKVDSVVVEVSDSGQGIDADVLPHVFERFGQARGRGGSAYVPGGLGLGLAISKGIIDLHEGTIVVHSAGAGKGARFQVELRAMAGVQPVAAPPRAAKRRPPRRVTLGARILLIEDEPDLADTLKMILQSHGYQVQTAPNAHDALEVDLTDVNLLVSDVGLPDIDGRELLKRLHAKRDVKALALSGYGTEADVRASHEAGFLRHLTKPVEAEELLGAIEAALASGGRPATGNGKN